jgi:hypothetical protein
VTNVDEVFEKKCIGLTNWRKLSNKTLLTSTSLLLTSERKGSKEVNNRKYKYLEVNKDNERLSNPIPLRRRESYLSARSRMLPLQDSS